MTQAEDAAKQHSLPPPSYEEAVFGTTSADEQNGNFPFTEALTHTPYTTQAVHHFPQLFPTTQFNVQQYSLCPPGATPLCNLSEILIYPSKGRVFKIKDQHKVTIMTVKFGFEEECCGSCNPDNKVIFTLRSVDGQVISACASLMLDSLNCCSYSKRHLEVQAPLNVPFGIVRIHSFTRCSVENQSGDVLYELERQRNCCELSPYQIFVTDGRQVGHIDNSQGIKHRLMLPKEMPIRHKILLLFFTVSLQAEADSRRRSS